MTVYFFSLFWSFAYGERFDDDDFPSFWRLLYIDTSFQMGIPFSIRQLVIDRI